MITDARLYWILHGLFANAQTKAEVRFIHQKFVDDIDAWTTKTDVLDGFTMQLKLSEVMERRISELEGINRGQDVRAYPRFSVGEVPVLRGPLCAGGDEDVQPDTERSADPAQPGLDSEEGRRHLARER